MTSELKRMISEGAEPKDVAMAFIKSMKGKGKGKTTTRQEPVEGSGWLDKKEETTGCFGFGEWWRWRVPSSHRPSEDR